MRWEWNDMQCDVQHFGPPPPPVPPPPDIHNFHHNIIRGDYYYKLQQQQELLLRLIIWIIIIWFWYKSNVCHLPGCTFVHNRTYFISHVCMNMCCLCEYVCTNWDLNSSHFPLVRKRMNEWMNVCALYIAPCMHCQAWRICSSNLLSIVAKLYNIIHTCTHTHTHPSTKVWMHAFKYNASSVSVQ